MGQDAATRVLARPEPLRRPVRLMALVGTRPEAVKVAPVARAARDSGDFEVCLVSTGQHPEHMLEALGHFGLQADVEVGLFQPGQSLTGVTTRALEAITREIERFEPDVVVVQGDTTTAFAGALAAFYHKVPVAHVEAGLRSGNVMNPYPEEMNRKLIGQLAAFHFAPTSHAADMLAAEGIAGDQVFVAGNTVVDALYTMLQTTSESRDESVADRYFDSKAAGHHAGHVLVTAHRRESWGQPLDDLASGLKDAASRLPDHLFFVPLHPNPLVRRSFHDLPPNVIVGDPLPYPVFLRAMETADVIVTDSGGVLEEAVALGKRVIIAREETERPEAIAAGAADLVGLDPTRITNAVCAALESSRTGTTIDVFGDGRAAARIVGWLRWYFGHASKRPKPFAAGAQSTHAGQTEQAGAWL